MTTRFRNKFIAAIVLLSLSFISDSSLAIDCSGLAAWVSTTSYNGGAEVQHNNKAYRANWWTQNQNPATHSGQWQEWTLLGNCGGNPTNEPPIANANGPYAGDAGDLIDFTSVNSEDPDGAISSYLWGFGDGSTSVNPNPSHGYATPGNYTVTLTVTDDDGASDTDSTTANIMSGSSSSSSSSGSSSGSGCAALQRYVAGSQYSSGQRVFNVLNSTGESIEYVCDIAGWCSSTAAWAYEPGNGMHWDDAWNQVGPCGPGGDPQDPVANANGPYSGEVNNSIAFSSAGSDDPDGNIVAYAWNFGDGSTSSNANPNHTYSSTGIYTVTLTVTDDDGRSNTDSTTTTINDPGTGPGPLPRRLLIGYWHNFINQAGYLPIGQVSADWDIVNLSFAENARFGQPGEVEFAPAEESETSFRAGVQLLQSRGQKVLISLGGANAHIQLNSIQERDNFVRTMGDIIARYNLDGMDIDLEGSSINMTAGDTVANPQTPAIVNLIAATRALKARFGAGFILTMAPETAYVQGGYANFSGIWGAYLPLIHALRNDLTVLHVQHYNTGTITAANDVTYSPATADFHVALSDMMITGFPAGRDSNNFFPGLRADQVAFGLPASGGAAGSGQTTPAVVHQALDCLIKLTRCNSYQPGRAHSDFRGLMTWSINWDKSANFGFSTPHRAYLDSSP